MRLLHPIPVLLAAVLLAGCQSSSESASSKEGAKEGAKEAAKGVAKAGAKDGKERGGLLSLIRPERITIPEGETFPLVLETALSSATSQAGDVVVARLAENIRLGEKVLVPSGSEVRGRVISAVPSGRVKTRAQLAFGFDTLLLGNKEHAIDTRPIDITARDTHKKDAATIAIGAGAGAVVGAIAKGGKGAAIGTLIGGAAGTGVMLTNTGKEVVLGTGSRVTVRLVREARL